MADNNQIVGASLQVDSDQAVKNVLKLKSTVEDLRKELKKAEAGSDEQVAAYKKLKAAEDELAKANQQLVNSNKEATGHFGNLKQKLAELPGAAGAAGEGVTSLSGKFKALLANPVVLVITAIVAVLAALGKAFASTRKGADLIGQGMAFVSGAMDKAVQIVGDFVASITSLGDLLSKVGDFLAHPIDNFKKLGKEIGEAAAQTANLKKEQQQLERDMINNMARNRELIQQEEALKNIRDNEFNSTKQRIDANEKAAALEKQRLATLEQLQLREVDRLQKLIKLKGGEAFATNEELKELREAQGELADLREESIGRENEFITNRFSLQKEAEDKAKELRDKAREEEKQRQQNLLEFTTKLAKLRQDNELALIKDGYERELKALDFRIAEEKKLNERAFKERKITREQLNQLTAELDKQANTQRNEILDKHNKEIEAKEIAFQKNVEDLKKNIRLSSIKDNRELERVQLQMSYEEQLQNAITLYKDNQDKFQAVKQLIDEQYRIDQQKMDEKNAAEDAKKKADAEIARLSGIASDPESSFQARREAIDAEIALNQELYDKKQITLEQFTERDKELHKARKALGKEEVEAAFDNAGKIAGLFENLSNTIGKQTAAGKALSVAATTIQTIQSATASYNAMAAIPVVGPALGIAAAAAAVASGIANVRKIIAVKIPGQGDVGGNAPAAPMVPNAPLAPTQTSTKIDSESINDIGNAAAGGVNSVRAYVVESDSADARERAEMLNRAARLGG